MYLCNIRRLTRYAIKGHHFSSFLVLMNGRQLMHSLHFLDYFSCLIFFLTKVKGKMKTCVPKDVENLNEMKDMMLQMIKCLDDMKDRIEKKEASRL